MALSTKHKLPLLSCQVVPVNVGIAAFTSADKSLSLKWHCLIYQADFQGNFSFCGVHINLGHAGAQLVEALRYKSEGRGFDSRWFHWNSSLT